MLIKGFARIHIEEEHVLVDYENMFCFFFSFIFYFVYSLLWLLCWCYCYFFYYCSALHNQQLLNVFIDFSFTLSLPLAQSYKTEIDRLNARRERAFGGKTKMVIIVFIVFVVVCVVVFYLFSNNNNKWKITTKAYHWIINLLIEIKLKAKITYTHTQRHALTWTHLHPQNYTEMLNKFKNWAVFQVQNFF